MVINSRDVMAMSFDEIWQKFDTPRNEVIVQFDDGSCQTTSRELIYSQYFWEFHRKYPHTPIEMKHLIDHSRRISKGTPLSLLGHALWSTHDAYQGMIPLTDLQRLAYDVIQLLYNEMVVRIPQYVTSLSARDVIEVVYDPFVVDLLETTVMTREGIEITNRKLYDYLKTEGVLPGNQTAESIKCGLLGYSPTSQLYGIRGTAADIDNVIFPFMLESNYCKGHHKLSDYAAESRSASRFLHLAGSPLQQVEYKNREFQLLSQSLRYMFEGDCGSTYLLPIPEIREKDLKTFEGKYYYVDNQETGERELHRITLEDRHLIGKRLEVRSVLGCMCLPRQGVCEACIGELALQFPMDSTIGHISIIELCSGISQSVLSAKHDDVVGKVDSYDFTEDNADAIDAVHAIELYGKRSKDGTMKVKDGESRLKLKADLKGRQAKLIIDKSTNLSLPDITQGRPVETLCLSRTSHIRTCRIELVIDGEPMAYEFGTMIGSRAAYFTSEFLSYIKAVDWSSVKRERQDKKKKTESFVIPLDRWDFSKPVFDFQRRADTTLDFMKQVVSVVKAKERVSKSELMPMEDLHDRVMELHELVNSRFPLNLAHSEIISSLCLVRNSRDDFRFPSPDEPRDFAPFNTVMAKRSLSASYAYEKHSMVYHGMGSFLYPRRPSHPMDRIFLP